MGAGWYVVTGLNLLVGVLCVVRGFVFSEDFNVVVGTANLGVVALLVWTRVRG